MKGKFIISLFSVVMIVTTSILWLESCRKPVGSVEMLKTEEIIKELAVANTQEKAEVGINHLIEKIGIGITKENSDYEYYILDEGQIKDLATFQAGFVNGDTSINIGTYYTIFSSYQDTLEQILKNEYVYNTTLSKTLKNLQMDAKVAMANLENPNNAMLGYIVSENGEIPNDIPLYDSTQIISPVQAFCLNIMTSNKYAEYVTEKSTDGINLSGCEIGCIALGSVCSAMCSAATGFFGTAACIFGCTVATALCLEGCHDQGGGK